MSWSISFMGAPRNVAIALKNESEKLSGESKVEYDAALPHMVGLVEQNFENVPMVKINASGHGYVNGENEERQCSVAIDPVYTQLV